MGLLDEDMIAYKCLRLKERHWINSDGYVGMMTVLDCLSRDELR